MCASSIFLPVPRFDKIAERNSALDLATHSICESMMTFDDNRHEENTDPTANDGGLPPSINIPKRIDNVREY